MLDTDGQVTSKTLETCCEVLQRVREEAASREAGIIFLGAGTCKHETLLCSLCFTVIQQLLAQETCGISAGTCLSMC